MSPQPRLWLIRWGITLLLIGCPVVAAYWLWSYLGREGYLYPVPYAKFLPDGRVEEEGFRMRELNGLWYQQGPVIQYHLNGMKSLEGVYNHGCQVGTWKMWTPDGTITEATEYADSPNNFVHPGDLCIRRTEYENGVAKRVLESWYERDVRCCTYLNPDGTPSKVEERDRENHIQRVIIYENGVAKVVAPDVVRMHTGQAKTTATDASKPADTPSSPGHETNLSPGPSTVTP